MHDELEYVDEGYQLVNIDEYLLLAEDHINDGLGNLG